MVECVLVLLAGLVFGYFLGYLYYKYKLIKSELYDNINIIKEDITHLHVLFANYVGKSL